MPFLIPATAGDLPLVEDGLRLARELAGAWPKSRLPLAWKGADAWISYLEGWASNVE